MKKITFLSFYIGCSLFSFSQIKSTDLVPFNKGGKWGFSDINKKIIIPVQFEDAWPFSDGLAPVKKEGKWAYIDSTNKAVIPYQFSFAQNFSQGYALVEINNLSGLINRKGKLIIPCSFKRIKKTDAEGRWLAEDTTGIQHLFTVEGKDIYRAKNIDVNEFYSQVEITRKISDNEEIDLTGIISTRTGEELIPPVYESIDFTFKSFGVDPARLKKLANAPGKDENLFIENKDLAFAVTEFHNKKGLFSFKSGEIFPCVFDNFDTEDLMENGFAVARQDSFVYVIDLKGKKLSSAQTRKINGTPGIEWLDYEMGGKHGVMDEKGNVLTPPIFLEVSTEGKTAIGILSTGIVLVPGKINAGDTLKYIYDDFDSGRAGRRMNIMAVAKKDKWGIVNTKGKVIVPLIYKDADIREDFIRLRDTANKYGIANFGGKLKLKCEADEIVCALDKNLSAFLLRKNAVFGVFKNGKFIASMNVPDTVYAYTLSAFNDNDGLYIWMNYNDKVGMIKLINNEFKNPVPFKYTQVGEFLRDKIILGDTSGLGVFSKSGVNVIPCRYATITDALEQAGSFDQEYADFFICETKTGTSEIRGRNGELLQAVNEKSGSVTQEDMFDPMLYGIEFPSHAKIIYNPSEKAFFSWKAFDITDAPGESNPRLLISDSTGLYALMDKKGNKLTPFMFRAVDDGIYDYKNEKSILVFTDEKKLKGLVTNNGKIICAAKYLSLDPTDSYSSFYAKVLIPGEGDGDIRTGIINTEGQEIIPCNYKQVEPVYDDVFSVYSENGYQMLYDDEGHVLLKDGIAKDPVELKSKGKIGGKWFIRVELYDAFEGIQCFIDENGNIFYEKE